MAIRQPTFSVESFKKRYIPNCRVQDQQTYACTLARSFIRGPLWLQGVAVEEFPTPQARCTWAEELQRLSPIFTCFRVTAIPLCKQWSTSNG